MATVGPLAEASVIAVCADDSNCYRGALHALANCLIEWPLPVLPESPAGLSQGSASGQQRPYAVSSAIGCRAPKPVTRTIQICTANSGYAARQLSENRAPTLGTQNQAVDFILANPERRRAVTEWATSINIEEASTAPQRRLSYNQLYQQVHASA
jgi:hypothetical protein